MQKRSESGAPVLGVHCTHAKDETDAQESLAFAALAARCYLNDYIERV